MSGFIITMMMHLFKRLPKVVLVFYSQNIYCEYILGMLGSQERAATILIMGTLKDNCLKEDS